MTNQNTIKNLHISHNDLDGIGCHFITKQVIKTHWEKKVVFDYVTVKGANELEEFLLENDYRLNNYENIIITDIAIDNNILELIKNRDNVRYFDHHEVSDELREEIDKYNRNRIFIRSTDSDGTPSSGTKVYWDWIVSHLTQHGDRDYLDSIYFETSVLGDVLHLTWEESYRLKMFVDIVSAYDTYYFKSCENEIYTLSPRLNKAVYILGGVENIKEVDKYLEVYIKTFRYEGENHISYADIKGKYSYISKIIEAEETNINRLYSKMTVDIFSNNLLTKYVVDDEDDSDMELTYGIVQITDSKLVSELSNRYLEEHPDVCFLVIMGNSQIGLRTNKGWINLSKLATKFGGGGHRKAAGFPHGINIGEMFNLLLTTFIQGGDR